MEEYYITTDMYGRHVIVHGVEWKNHKYIKKLRNGAFTRYFYTVDELRAYLQAVRTEIDSKGKAVGEAAASVLERMNSNDKAGTKEATKSATLSTKGTASTLKEKIGEVAEGFRNKAEQVHSSVSSAIKNASEKKSKSEKAWDNASDDQKIDILIAGAVSNVKMIDKFSKSTGEAIDNYLKSDVGRLLNKENRNEPQKQESSKEERGETTNSAHGITGHNKKVTGEAKEGSLHVRKEDGSDPHAGNHINIYDDEATDKYFGDALKKLKDLGGPETAEGAEYYAKVLAEASFVMSAKIVNENNNLNGSIKEFEKAKNDYEEDCKKLAKIQADYNSNPQSVNKEQLDWMKATISEDYAKVRELNDVILYSIKAIDEYQESLEIFTKEFKDISVGHDWDEILGVDPKFAATRR